MLGRCMAGPSMQCIALHFDVADIAFMLVEA
jgi:hypothetical protein